MSDLGNPELWSLVFRGLIGPLVGYLFWTYKKQHEKIEELTLRITKVEQTNAVIVSILDNMKDDIREMKMDMKRMLERK